MWWMLPQELSLRRIKTVFWSLQQWTGKSWGEKGNVSVCHCSRWEERQHKEGNFYYSSTIFTIVVLIESLFFGVSIFVLCLDSSPIALIQLVILLLSAVRMSLPGRWRSEHTSIIQRWFLRFQFKQSSASFSLWNSWCGGISQSIVRINNAYPIFD